MPPQVSVIIPIFNAESYLREAIESVLDQSFSDFELILVDDASKDGSWKIIEEYTKKDPRVVALKNEKNRHIAATRNRGLQVAKGKFVAFLDSDDVAESTRLEDQMAYMEANLDCAVCGSNFWMINEKNEVIGEKTFPENDKEIKEAFFYFNPFGQNTVMIRKKCLDDVGSYDESLRGVEDLDIWMKMGVKYRLHNLQKNLVRYRIHGRNSIFTNQKVMIKGTLALRKKAAKEYGYKMSLKAKLAFFTTWLMLFLPPKLVFRLFNIFRGVHLKGQ